MNEKLTADQIYCFLKNKVSNINNETIVKCPVCKKNSKVIAFKDSEAFCELCEYHFAIECPNCSSIFDITLDNRLFKIIK